MSLPCRSWPGKQAGIHCIGGRGQSLLIPLPSLKLTRVYCNMTVHQLCATAHLYINVLWHICTSLHYNMCSLYCTHNF